MSIYTFRINTNNASVALPLDTTEPNRLKENQQARHYKVDFIDGITGEITWSSGVGSSYIMVASTGSTYVDNVYSSTSTGNKTPAKITTSVSNVPKSYNYGNYTMEIVVSVDDDQTVPIVVMQPSHQTAYDGTTATFTSVFSNADSYQWYLDDVVIVGATSASYTTGTLGVGDDGGVYKCTATNENGSTTTNEVYLAVFTEHFGLNPYTGFYEALPVTGSVDPTDDSRLIYVSNDGNDTTGDGTIETPYATWSKAWNDVRDGYPDWVLFKRGDVWTDVTMAPKKSGLDANNRIVVTAYGTGSRPLFKSSRIQVQGSNETAEYQLWDQLEFYEPINDPSAPEYGVGTPKSHGIRMLSGAVVSPTNFNHFLFQDMKISYYGTNIQIRHTDTLNQVSPMVGINLHRCVVVHSALDVNTFWTGISDFFITENTYVDAYWDDRDVFEHHIYLKYCNYQNTPAIERTGLIKRNIFIRAANHAIKNSGDSEDSNFDLTVDDNWMFLCGAGLCGHSDTLTFDDTLETTHHRHRYENNVVQEVAKLLKIGDPGEYTQSQFAIATNGTDIRIKNNLFSNNDTTEADSGTGIIIDIDETALNRRITVDGNKVYNWKSAYFDTNASYVDGSDAVLCEDYSELNGGIVDATGATDPGRDLLQYNNNVLNGSATTRDEALSALETALESRSARTWNPLYGAESMNNWWRTGADMTYEAPQPFVTAAWEFVADSTEVVVASGNLTLTEPAGVAEGDLLVAAICCRDSAVFSPPAGWVILQQQSSGNTVVNGTGSISSGVLAYIVRGASAPALTFTRTAGDLAIGNITAYRGVDSVSPVVTSYSQTAAQSGTPTITGVTTANSNDLIVTVLCGARPVDLWTNIVAATDPAIGSGAGFDNTADPIAGTWQLRVNVSSTTAARGVLGVADAIRATAGATGDLTGTIARVAEHAILIGVFKLG